MPNQNSNLNCDLPKWMMSRKRALLLCAADGAPLSPGIEKLLLPCRTHQEHGHSKMATAKKERLSDAQEGPSVLIITSLLYSNLFLHENQRKEKNTVEEMNKITLVSSYEL
ncbi:hypothetical protein F7725_010019, partial [Dissostichus mawsoni]